MDFDTAMAELQAGHNVWKVTRESMRLILTATRTDRSIVALTVS